MDISDKMRDKCYAHWPVVAEAIQFRGFHPGCEVPSVSKPTAIPQAIAQILRSNAGPMSAKEIYEGIVSSRLYTFKAQDPLSVVKNQLRRHCDGLNFPSARSMKYFAMTANGNYTLLAKPVRVAPTLYSASDKPGGKPGPLVSVPDDDEDGPAEPADGPSHSEIQWRLLDLGARLGLTTWAPMNDRGRAWDGRLLGDVPNMLTKLPNQFGAAAMRTIERIDVLWVKGESYLAGFEVEHTSTIYSGLLRMADLVTMCPNVEIKLYLAAPDVRAAKFAREVIRPTFSQRPKPLHAVCRFLPYSNLLDKLEEVKNVIPHLRPEFLDDIAETHAPSADG